MAVRGRERNEHTVYGRGEIGLGKVAQPLRAALTGLEVANASMYDGSTGAAEAVLMANRVTRRHKALISGGLHPQYRQVIETTARWEGFHAATRNAEAVIGLGMLDLAVGKWVYESATRAGAGHSIDRFFDDLDP